MPPESVEGYKFDSFEVKVRTQLLLRDGNRVRIERLPPQILLALLNSPGAVVAREELCARLWSGQSFQQADKGLQVAVAKLREALGEQAADPRFIKTVHRVGYQFIGEVAPLVESLAMTDLASPDVSRPADSPATAFSGNLAAKNGPKVSSSAAGSRLAMPYRVSLRRSFHFMFVGVVVLAVAAAFYLYHFRQPLASAGEQIALGDISNLTNDPGLDGTLSTAMRIKFQESPYFGIVPDPVFL